MSSHPQFAGQPQVERRQARKTRTDFLLVVIFWFSLAGLSLWVMPFDTERRELSHGVAPAIITAFAAMTVLCAAAIVLSRRQLRIFDRRAH